MMINVSVQYNGGFLPEIILLTAYYAITLGNPLNGALFPIGIEKIIYIIYFCYGSSNGY